MVRLLSCVFLPVTQDGFASETRQLGLELSPVLDGKVDFGNLSGAHMHAL